MPRPNPLLVTSAYSARNDQILTPRTPHSRAGRAEDARHGRQPDFNDADADADEDFYELGELQQRAPLLASSASASFPHRRTRNTDKKPSSSRPELNVSWPLVRNRIPLVAGLATALVLAFLVILSVETPEALHTYLHGAPLPFAPDVANANANESKPALSYANYGAFPLAPLEYREECAKFQAGMKGPMGKYWHVPPGGPSDVAHVQNDNTCTSSITYMLDGYVGLAADLALMAQAAGLARETNRTFLVDDRNWNRGRWTEHFQDVRVLQPGPEPGCLPPPPDELVACPRTARHWVISSRTAVFHFGHHFMDEFEDPYARELRRLKPIFSRAARAFAHTIRPSAASAARIRDARREVGGGYVAVHVRRGDRKAESWAFHGGYVPLLDYARTVQAALPRMAAMAPSGEDRDGEGKEVGKVWIASDDPAARKELAELMGDSSSSSTRLYSLDTSAYKELRALASGEAYVQAEFAALEEEERVRATRGALVDFAMVSGLWAWSDGGGDDAASEEETEAQLEGVVCTISTNFCKLSALGLGWSGAFGFDAGDPDRTRMTMDEGRKRWIEIDTQGNVDPVWRAFELF